MLNACKTSLFVAIAIIGLSGVASAQDQGQRKSKIVGETLVGLCGGSDAKGLEACEAYLDGTLDAALTYQQIRPQNGAKGGTLPAYICIPGEMNGIQLRRAFVDGYRSNPQPDRIAAGVILSVFSKAYPCNNRSNYKQ